MKKGGLKASQRLDDEKSPKRLHTVLSTIWLRITAQQLVKEGEEPFSGKTFQYHSL